MTREAVWSKAFRRAADRGCPYPLAADIADRAEKRAARRRRPTEPEVAARVEGEA